MIWLIIFQIMVVAFLVWRLHAIGVALDILDDRLKWIERKAGVPTRTVTPVDFDNSDCKTCHFTEPCICP